MIMLRKYLDLGIVFAISIIHLLFVILGVENVLRAGTGFLFLVVFPGYALFSVMYDIPENPQGLLGQFILSIPVSLAIMTVSGLVFMNFDIGMNSVLQSSVYFVFICTLMVAASMRRYDSPRVLNIPNFLVNLLVLFLIFPITQSFTGLFSSSKFHDSVITGLDEEYVAFYFSKDQSVDDASLTLSAGEPYVIKLGVDNTKSETSEFYIAALSGESVLGILGPLSIKTGEKWNGELSITMPEEERNKQISILLFRANDNQPYRKLNIWVDVFSK